MLNPREIVPRYLEKVFKYEKLIMLMILCNIVIQSINGFLYFEKMDSFLNKTYSDTYDSWKKSEATGKANGETMYDESVLKKTEHF